GSLAHRGFRATRADGSSSPPASPRTSTQGDGRSLNGHARNGLFDLPRFPPEPSLHIASRSNEVVLQLRFGQAPVTGPPQAVTSDQLALRPFNAVAMLHSFFKG